MGSAAPSIERIEVGIGGHYKVGEWTPLRMQVRAPAVPQVGVIVEVPDSDDNLTLRPTPLVDVSAGNFVPLETGFRTGRQHGELRVRLVDGNGETLAERRLRSSDSDEAPLRPALRHDVPLWVTFVQLPDLATGKSQSSEDFRGNSQPEATYEPQIASLLSLSDLPRHSRALGSVDILVLPTAATPDRKSLLSEMADDHDRLLREWVHEGGHLLLTVAQAADAYRGSLLARWVPVEVVSSASLRQFTGLESYSGISAPLRVQGQQPIARLSPTGNGRAIVKEGNSVLIASAAYGFGRVTVLGLDIEAPPVSTWPGLAPVLRKLAGVTVRGTPQRARQSNRQLSQTGITDLATQLQSARESFPAVTRPSHWSVLGLLAAYLLVIGPIDYLLVHRWLRKPELTWITFPLLVVVGAGAATWGAARANDRGLRFNQFDLVDYDTVTGSSRGRTWVSIYSPENRRYAVAVEPRAESPARLSWSGVPENSVSGVYRPGSVGSGRREYSFAPDGASVENLPILQWSTKSLCAAWEGTTETPMADSRLETAGPGQIAGTFTHHLPEALEDCLLIVGGWAYAPTRENASIPPGTAWTPGGPQGRARELKALLTGERRTRKDTENKTKTEVLTTTAPYNPFNDNPVDLVQMLSFHQAAGGSEYTGLANAALRDLELTHLMRLGRGILVGRIRSPQARVSIDQAAAAAPDASVAFVRLIVPVTNRERTPAATIPKAGEREQPASDNPGTNSP